MLFDGPFLTFAWAVAGLFGVVRCQILDEEDNDDRQVGPGSLVLLCHIDFAKFWGYKECVVEKEEGSGREAVHMQTLQLNLVVVVVVDSRGRREQAKKGGREPKTTTTTSSSSVLVCSTVCAGKAAA